MNKNLNGFNLNCKPGKTTCGAISKPWNPICRAFLKIPLILWFHKKINGTQWMVVPLDHSFACTIYLVLFRIEHLHLWPLLYNTIWCFVWSPLVLPFSFLADVMYMCKKHEDISKMAEQLAALALDLREMYFFSSKYYVLYVAYFFFTIYSSYWETTFWLWT